ncbi:hypothetical protein BJ165DRAFT_1348174 [Panaeolus papilionaceus]|nr:hypothetical protein BJ165DRAFT_1348174 [Panaeolus papilionaceus]
MFKSGHLTHLSLTPTQIIAAIMVITGGLLRLAAYKTLGPYFTFQVGIQPNQKLITHGVYAWVRHPSYTGTLLATPGFALWNMAPGSWVRESGVLDTWMGCVLGYGLAGLRLVMTYMLCFGRPPQEDERLREAFGREWEEWAGRVRYRLVPGVY